MRLKSLWIDGFKNLNNFKIDFEKRVGTTVLIGNNASGKSNVLEAISAIFAGLYNGNLEKLNFKFDLIYTILEGDTIRLSKKQKIRYRLKKLKQATFSEYPIDDLYLVRYLTEISNLPYQVIACYSGEELRLWESYYRNFYLNYNKNVIGNEVSIESNPQMLYVNKYYWDIALLTMLASDIAMSDIIGNFLLQTIKIIFDFKNLRHFRKNEVTNFIANLAGNNGIIEIDLENFKSSSNFETHRRLFNLLCVAKLPKNPRDKLITNLELIFTNGLITKDLSEGQKKQILIKLCLEILADENSLILFDEPDAHIHIANQKLIPKMLKEYEGKREVVLTTHSPMITYSFDNKHLAYIENGQINEQYNNQEKVLKGLGLGASEMQLFLQSNKDILIVEGKTDEIYISTALKALKEDNLEYENLDFNFLWLNGTDSDALKKVIKEFKPKENQTIIAFFDRDDSGHNCIKNTLDGQFGKDDFQCRNKDGICICFYPKKEGFTNSNFEIEDYFPIDILKNFTFNKITTYENLKQKMNKMKFAEHCTQEGFSKLHFNGFKILFNKILEIKEQS